MSAATSRIMLKVPIRLTRITFSKSASGIGPSRPTMRFAGPMPAQLTRMRAGAMLGRGFGDGAFTASSELVTSHAIAMPPISLGDRVGAVDVDVEQRDLGAGLGQRRRGLGAEAGSRRR